MQSTQTTANGSQANMRIFDQVRTVPKDALRPIEGGPLKGKSDINPVWRLQKLTELFGPAGIGWKIEQLARWTEKTESGETAVFCEVNLYVRTESGEWSEPVFGQGGNMLIRRSTEWVNGQPVTAFHIDDEAFKKAYTDAISVACKALGFAADVYYAQEETKYGSFRGENAPVQEQMHTQTEGEAPQWPWTTGFKEITPATANWKASVTQVSKMNDLSDDEILGRITSKFNITQENFSKLLSVANRAS